MINNKCPRCQKPPPGVVDVRTEGVVFCTDCSQWIDKETGKIVKFDPVTHQKIIIDV